MTPGDRVRINRDEKLYPSRGTWPRYRNKPGVVVILNEDEVGVEVGAVQARYRGDGVTLQYDHGQVAWFQRHELRAH
jgi:hypothetical protein